MQERRESDRNLHSRVATSAASHSYKRRVDAAPTTIRDERFLKLHKRLKQRCNTAGKARRARTPVIETPHFREGARASPRQRNAAISPANEHDVVVVTLSVDAATLVMLDCDQARENGGEELDKRRCAQMRVTPHRINDR